MNEPTDHEDAHEPLSSLRERLSAESQPTDLPVTTGPLADVRIGQVLSGTVTDVSRAHGAVVRLDGLPPGATAEIRRHDWSWRDFSENAVRVGRRVSARVVDIDPDQGRIRLSLAATENPELWAFLTSLNPGEVLSGTVASVERFGVFVDLDEGPAHPVFPGVGFVRIPDLTWRRFDELSEVAEAGQRVTGVLLDADTRNGEAVISLKALVPDPFQEFADTVPEGTTVAGRVTKLAPIGAFVRVADGVEGLVPLDQPTHPPVRTPDEAVRVGDPVTVTITRIERDRRRLLLSRGRRGSGG
ncbi:S1 RNA-binding domain-containing protein [Nocardiopsis sp. EMB25]|uniref:S1 RNA-binding domain-containing protein n=1 Tax=Nocardiopsis sp. EMB25 TaxID=2835867 RepID=UPI002283F5BE|nr:S1 RNA-binding domain-containing protein [Nocardiopsis sp. EMB25]MCY9783223.1 S1 RNA-binding domain-containing protein [Nocardiopsis sp. EMB25]